ncbi:DMT family transporter (plasmid) [Paracoccus sp. TK19116]|uniref:DMT family transporter n=1 Tax=Paracoccus albicereus TaxID=2922394 RepID=A0ABT1MMB3_9RHOB|nr:DMT family transporter [Paracoccus albicereus]
MIAAMGAFAVEDSFIKAASKTLPVGEILILFGLGGTIVFAGLALSRGERLFSPDVLSRPMRIRVGFEIVGRLFYALAITLIPLSAATVILQATPLVVVAGAALLFGEKVGWRRWLAIVVGLAGVVVIVKPGAEGFSALSLLAVIGMIGFAGRDLASRAAPASLSTAILGLYGFGAVVIAGVLVALWDRTALVMPAAGAAGAMLAAVLSGVAAYSCLMKAMRTGEVSAVTPFRYTRLLFGVAFGLAFFGERFTLSMLIGSSLIVLSGVFILWRGRQVRGEA